MLNETGSKSDQEKEISMIVSSARDEDELYEKTGIDLVQFNNSVIKSKLNQDPDFIKIV
jgi:hypothetical protein